jgi:hypothetical protein
LVSVLSVADNIITLGHTKSAVIEMADIVTSTCDQDITDILGCDVIFYTLL